MTRTALVLVPLITAVIVSLALVTLAFQFSPAASTTLTQQDVSDVTHELKRLQAEIEQVHATGIRPGSNGVEAAVNRIYNELDDTVKRIDALTQRQDQLTKKLATTAPNSTATEQSFYIEETITEEQRQLREQEQLQEALAHLEHMFQSEDVDTAWSGSTESQLTSAFSATAQSGQQLLSVTCRTTVCQLQIAHDKHAGFETALLKVLEQSELGTSEGFITSTPSADGRVSARIFVSRNGHSLLPAAANE